MKPTRRERRLAGDVREALSGCPAADELQAFVGSELQGDAARTIDAHLATCDACREALEFLQGEARAETAESANLPLDVARRSDVLIDALSRPGDATAKHIARGPRSVLNPWGWGLGVAAAAMLALVAVVPSWLSGPDPGVSGFREPQGAEIRPLIDADERLPRDAFVLGWSEGPEGTRYDVTVLTDRLEIVDQRQGLVISRHQVAGERLEGLAPGARLLWQVEAILPDGSRATSETFVATLE